MVNKEFIAKNAVVVNGSLSKHLAFAKQQIESQISNTTWYEKNYINLFDESHKTFVVEIEGSPVAFCSFIIQDNVADIDATATKKEFQNLGLASICFNHSLEVLKNEGINRVFLEVAQNNKCAINFYEKMGFVFQNRSIKNYYNDGQDALVYALILN